MSSIDSSFDSDIADDVLAGYQNGYDGRLRSLTVFANVDSDRLQGRVELSVCRDADDRHRIVVTFDAISLVRISAEWFVGGGSVLYNGGRLLAAGNPGELVVDLDPGLAWLTSSGVRHASTCLMCGVGNYSVVPLDEGGGHL